MISNKEMADMQKVWQQEAAKFNWLAENVPHLLEQMRTMLLSYQALEREVVALRAMCGIQSLDDLNGVGASSNESQEEFVTEEEGTVQPEAGAQGDQGVHSGQALEGSDGDSGGHEDHAVPRAEETQHTSEGLRQPTNNRRRNRRSRKKNKR